jgi:hypothetical protein
MKAEASISAYFCELKLLVLLKQVEVEKTTVISTILLPSQGSSSFPGSVLAVSRIMSQFVVPLREGKAEDLGH